MATAALWVASGWVPPAAHAASRESFYGHSRPNAASGGVRQTVRSSIETSLCKDTSGYVIQQLWPKTVPPATVASFSPSSSSSSSSGQISPRTFEYRLRRSAPMLQDLQQVAAVSADWKHRIESVGWAAAHRYLYQVPGTKLELQQRYTSSMAQLLVKDWLRRAPADAWRQPMPGSVPCASCPEGLVGHIVSYVVL
eukprot:TRINITY_DN7567_c3_g1_i1.p1 TRINITY_DN7567_c3_g1~~TRINITY_DN7567_c3_g1_i1.p1  ORF type:complete len:196 (-),score=34.01 TRINITY_DN7567_c3_g1_i1:59-646(-)